MSKNLKLDQVTLLVSLRGSKIQSTPSFEFKVNSWSSECREVSGSFGLK